MRDALPFWVIVALAAIFLLYTYDLGLALGVFNRWAA